MAVHRRRVVLAVVLVLGAPGFAAHGTASPTKELPSLAGEERTVEGFELAWTAPPQCAARPDLGALVKGASGAAEVRITPRGARWSLTLTFRAPVQGSRTLEADTCAEAAEAAVLLLRLGARGTLPIDTESRLASPEAVPPEGGASPPGPDFAFTSLFAVGGGQALALPRVDPRAGALLWVQRGPWAVVASLGAGLPSRYAAGPAPSALVEVSTPLDGSAGGCFVRSSAFARVAGCVDLQVAWWRMRGLNVSVPRDGSAAFAAVGPSVRATMPLGDRLALLAGTSFRATLVRPRAVFDGTGSALAVGPFAISVELGLGARW